MNILYSWSFTSLFSVSVVCNTTHQLNIYSIRKLETISDATVMKARNLKMFNGVKVCCVFKLDGLTWSPWQLQVETILKLKQTTTTQSVPDFPGYKTFRDSQKSLQPWDEGYLFCTLPFHTPYITVMSCPFNLNLSWHHVLNSGSTKYWCYNVFARPRCSNTKVSCYQLDWWVPFLTGWVMTPHTD